MNLTNLLVVHPLGAMPFIYRGCRFMYEVELVSAEAFQAHVRYESGLPGVAPMALPNDAAPYSTKEEASRHAQQQAIRWVHDRQGNGTGRF